MPFQIQKANMAALRKLSVGDRVAMARDEQFGPFLMSLMTPTDVALMFPRYYRDVLPNVSGFQKAMPTSMSVARQEAIEEQLRNTTSGSGAGANYSAGGWRKRWQQNIDSEFSSATPTKAGTRAPPQLTPEQKQSFDTLKQGPLAADDPRAKMYSNLSDSQLTQVGISRYEEGGKKFLKYDAPTPSEEQVKKFAASDQRGGNSFFNAIIRAEGTGKYGDPYETSLGYMKSPKPLTEMTMAESLEWGQTVRRSQGLNSSAKGAFQIVNTTQEAAMRALGIGMNEKFSPENQRRMASWIAQQQGLGAWEGLKIHKDQWQIAQESMSQGMHKEYADPITTDYSQKNVELARERLIRNIEAKRIGSLAAFTSADLPPPGSPEANQMVGGSKDAQAVAETIKNKYAHLDNPQCVALAKAYVGATGSVTDWRRGSNVMDGTLKPGTPIATFMARDGSPSMRYDDGGTGAPGNHTTHAAVFLDYVRDGAGKITGIKVMEQYKTSGGAHEKIYPVGGFGTGNASNYYSINDSNGSPLGPNNPMIATGAVDAPASAMPADTPKQKVEQQSKSLQSVEAANRLTDFTGAAAPAPAFKAAPIVNNQPEPTATGQAATAPAAAAATNQQPNASATNQQPTKQPTAQVKPTANGPERYKVDTAKFVAAIRATPEFQSQAGVFGGMVPDATIINGFNDDPRVKAAGVHLDEKGVMHFAKGQTDESKQVMEGMNAKSFMTKIEEKKPDVTPTPEKKNVEPSQADKKNADTTHSAQSVAPTPTPAAKGSSPATATATPADKSAAPAAPAPAAKGSSPTPAPEVAPTKVKTNADGGSNKINTEQISAYPIGGLKGDNTVIVNKQQKPLFTMNTNESAVFDPSNKTVNVAPSQKTGDVGPQKQENAMTAAAQEFKTAVEDIKSSFEKNNTSSTQPQSSVNKETFMADSAGGPSLNNMNNLSSDWFNGSPSLKRASYRAGGVETGEPNSGFHYSQQNRS